MRSALLNPGGAEDAASLEPNKVAAPIVRFETQRGEQMQVAGLRLGQPDVSRAGFHRMVDL
jgi:hypothetical protein